MKSGIDGLSVNREKLEVVWQTVAMRDRQNCGNSACSPKTGNVQGRGWVEIWVLCVVIIMLSKVEEENSHIEKHHIFKLNLSKLRL